MAAAAGLAVLGFLGYYLPVYHAPHLFPSAAETLPLVGRAVRTPVGGAHLGRLLTTIELVLLTLMNIVGVHGSPSPRAS